MIFPSTLPIENVFWIAFCIGFAGFILGMIVFDRTSRDYETDFGVLCTKTRHFFPTPERIKGKLSEEVYCFCGNEVMELNPKGYYIIKE
jgi:hypothetical protein